MDLYLDIALDGVILYDNDDYTAERLGYLKALIRQEGLRREKDGHDLIWHWEKPPGPHWSLQWEKTS